MTSNRRKSVFAELGLVYATIIWGTTFVIVKDALEFISPLTLVTWRFLLAAAVLTVWLMLKGRGLLANWRPGVTLGVLLWLIYAPQTIGLDITTASNSAFITGTFVAFVPFFDWIFLRRRFGPRRILSVLLCLGGLWLLTGGIVNANLGDLLTLITAAACAGHIFVADGFIKQKLDPYVLSMQQFATVGGLSLIAAVLFGSPLLPTRIDTVSVIVFLALFPTLSAFVIQLVAQRHTSAMRVSLIFVLEPVFAAAVAWTVGGELFLWSKALGGLLVVLALLSSGKERPHIEVS